MATGSGTPINCLPWWHEYVETITKGRQFVLKSGCAVNAQGNVACTPENLRKNAEAQLKAIDWWPKNRPLTLETYTLARYMASEVGSGTPEERVAVGEAAVNRAKLQKLPKGILSLLLYRQGNPSHPNYGWYGPIHGEAGVQTAPYGRWAATSRDPSVGDIILAELILAGLTDNFNRGADDQAGYQYAKAFPNPANSMRNQASKGNYWVGPLPNVDHWHTTQFRYLGLKPDSGAGKILLDRSLQVFSDPNRKSPTWGPLPLCKKPLSAIIQTSGGLPSSRLLLGLIGAAGLGGAYILARRRKLFV
jgi:hypothetical protein